MLQGWLGAWRSGSAPRLHEERAWRTQFASLGPKWTKASKTKPTLHFPMDRRGHKRLQFFPQVRRRLGGTASPSRIRPPAKSFHSTSAVANCEVEKLSRS